MRKLVLTNWVSFVTAVYNDSDAFIQEGVKDSN